jgi:hypothetical protein
VRPRSFARLPMISKPGELDFLHELQQKTARSGTEIGGRVLG